MEPVLLHTLHWASAGTSWHWCTEGMKRAQHPWADQRFEHAGPIPKTEGWSATRLFAGRRGYPSEHWLPATNGFVRWGRRWTAATSSGEQLAVRVGNAGFPPGGQAGLRAVVALFLGLECDATREFGHRRQGFRCSKSLHQALRVHSRQRPASGYAPPASQRPPPEQQQRQTTEPAV